MPSNAKGQSAEGIVDGLSGKASEALQAERWSNRSAKPYSHH